MFTNRWMALVFAAGVIWMALDIANPGETAADGNSHVTSDVTGAKVTNEQVESLLSDL